VAKDQGHAVAYDQYGWTFATQARFDEALANEKKALELDPLNPYRSRLVLLSGPPLR
jgi:tetratricopeptide (TPR) repeat protein